MASNHSLVDDFLSGRTTQVEPPRQMPAGETTGEEGRNAQNLARVMDPSVMTSLFAKQQRLLTIVSEAQAIIAELQQYGMFPSLSPNAAGGASPGDAFLQLLSMNAPKPPTSDVWGTPAAAAATAGTTPSAASHPGQKMPATAYDTDAAVEMSATRGNSGSPYHNNASNAAGYFAPNNNTAADDFKQGNKFGKQGGEYGSNNNNNNNNSNKRGSTNNNNNNAPILMENSILALVEFKRGRTRKYVCDNPDVTPGIYVLVDGDRGTDCGLLVQTIQRLPNGETSISCMDGCDINDEKVRLENGRVIRPATNEDIDRLHNVIANAEAVALKTCRQRCEEQGIDIGLVDVEYQFDMKKISFFFDCDHSVDFRNLVRELYRTFGARIWMENLNPKVKNSIPDSPHGGGRDNNNGHHYNNNNNNNSYYRRNNNRNDGNSKVYY